MSFFSIILFSNHISGNPLIKGDFFGFRDKEIQIFLICANILEPLTFSVLVDSNRNFRKRGSEYILEACLLLVLKNCNLGTSIGLLLILHRDGYSGCDFNIVLLQRPNSFGKRVV